MSCTAKTKEPLTPDQRRVVEEHVELAEKIAKARRNPFISLADRTQDAYMGLIDAAKGFEPERDVKFTTYAQIRITGAIIDAERERSNLIRTPRHAKKKGDLPLKIIHAGTIHNPNVDDGDIESVLFVAAEEPQPLDDRDALDVAMRSLPDRERRLVRRHVCDGLTLNRAAAGLGISESRASQLIPDCLERLRATTALAVYDPNHEGRSALGDPAAGEGEFAARIEALRRNRAERAAACGSVPAAVRITADDITEVLDKPKKAPSIRAQRVLDAAAKLYGPSGVAKVSEIAAAAGVSDATVYMAIPELKNLGVWPYTSPPKGRQPADPSRVKSKPDLSCLDEPPKPIVRPKPAPESIPVVRVNHLQVVGPVRPLPPIDPPVVEQRFHQGGNPTTPDPEQPEADAFTATFAVVEAFDRLPTDARKALAAHLSKRGGG